MAWLRATHPDASLRDGRAAVRFAEQACIATDFKDPSKLDTLAAALAEAGRFDAAARVLRDALSLIPPERQSPYRARLELYELGKPYHESVRESFTP